MEVVRQQNSAPLRLVVSTAADDVMRERTARTSLPRLVINDEPRSQLLKTMTLVCATRQLAAHRMMRKQALSRHTLMALIGLCVGIWTWLAINVAAADPALHRRLAFIGVVSAVVALLLACSRTEGRAAVRAYQLGRCAAEIGDLRDKLANGDGDDASVPAIRQHYRDAMRRCKADHIYADYLAARLACSAKDASPWRARLLYAMNVYPKSAAALMVPLVAMFFG
jgi:SMODS and SLOG-associating 2TM effector domain family 5